MFDIIIVTWRNLDYLRLTLEGIAENSAYEHKVHVFCQTYHEPTYNFLYKRGIPFTGSSENIGLSAAANRTVKLFAQQDILCFFDDDMYAAPGWDTALLSEYKPNRTVCSVMVEQGFGHNLQNFRKQSFIYSLKRKNPHYNNSSYPILVDRRAYQSVGGYDEDFPNVGAELGLAKRLWDYGITEIGREVPESRVYHFPSQSLNRLDRDKLAKEREVKFLDKYGITAPHFRQMMQKNQPVFYPVAQS